MLTKIGLCNQALLKLGESAIASFGDDVAAAQIAAKLYDATIDNLLCMHAWRFAMKKFALHKTKGGYFVRPRSALRVISCDHPAFEVVGNKIFCPAASIELIAVARAEVEDFPAYFAAAAATKLALEFCVPLTGNQNVYAILNALFESEFRAAKFIDSSFGANQAILNFPLVTVRR